MAEAVQETDKPQLTEELAGMEQEAKLLAGFLDIPSISKAWCLPATGGGTTLTVQDSAALSLLHSMLARGKLVVMAQGEGTTDKVAQLLTRKHP